MDVDEGLNILIGFGFGMILVVGVLILTPQTFVPDKTLDTFCQNQYGVGYSFDTIDKYDNIVCNRTIIPFPVEGKNNIVRQEDEHHANRHVHN